MGVGRGLCPEGGTGSAAETGAGPGSDGEALRPLAERGLLHLSCTGGGRLAHGYRTGARPRPGNRAGGARRPRAIVGGGVRRSAACADFLLCPRPGGPRLERGVSL